jgi:hypothetical protein
MAGLLVCRYAGDVDVDFEVVLRRFLQTSPDVFAK